MNGRGGTGVCAALVLLVVSCAPAGDPGPPRVEVRALEGGSQEIVLRGLSRDELAAAADLGAVDLAASLRVHTAGGSDLPPVLGRAEHAGDRLRWTPEFPLVAGSRYVLSWSPAGARPLELEFAVPAAAVGAPPRVSAIHPAVDIVPANLLRLYVVFTRPMRAGRAAEHVEIRGDGHPLDGALVVPGTELWSPDSTRLTLLFDPGRIKQGVGPNLDVGPPLAEGMELELHITPGWPAQDGVATTAAMSRTWRVGPADRSRPDAAAWEVTPPSMPAGAVAVGFPEPLDHALLSRLLRVATAAGQPVAGRDEAGAGGTLWEFRPENEWEPGDYVILVDPLIEDLAGNSLERLFDEPLESDRVGVEGDGAVALPFVVRAR